MILSYRLKIRQFDENEKLWQIAIEGKVQAEKFKQEKLRTQEPQKFPVL